MCRSAKPHRRAAAVLALVGAATVLILSAPVGATPITDPATGPTTRGAPAPCDMPVVSIACAAVDGVVDRAADVPASMAGGVVRAFADWVASGAARLVASAGDAISANTAVSLTGERGKPWFLDQYRRMAAIAGLVMAPMLLLAALQAALTASGAFLWRALANLPVATLGTAAAVTVTQLLLGVTDWACAHLAATVPGDTRTAFAQIAQALTAVPTPDPAGRVAAGAFGVTLLALFMAVTAVVVWLELVVREAAIYLTVVFLPLGFATYIWPALSPWLRRLVEVIVALTLSKLVIVAALALAGGALASQEGFGTLIAGAGMLLLAAFAPFALFKLVPIASMAGIASLEGLSRRAPGAVGPRLANVAQARHLAAVSALPAAIPAHRSLPPGSPGGTGGPLPPPPPPPGSAVPATHSRSVGGGGVPTSAPGVATVGAGATALLAQTRRQFEQPLPFPEPETEQR